MNLVYSHESRERIRSLSPEAKKGIKEILESLSDNPYLGKPLQRELTGFRSIAFKRYRVVYKIMNDESQLKIYSVGHRKEIYTDFSKSLIANHPRAR